MFGWLRGSSPSCFLGGIIRSSLLYLPVLRRVIPLIEAFKQYIESIQNTLTDRYSYFLSGLFMVKMRREKKFSQVLVCQYLNEAVGISPILLPRAFFLLCFLKPPSGKLIREEHPSSQQRHYPKINSFMSRFTLMAPIYHNRDEQTCPGAPPHLIND